MASDRGSTDERRVEATAEALQSDYLATQYHYVQFLTEHLVDCAAAFGGDLDSVLVIAVLGQRRLEIYREDPDGIRPDVARIAMSALRISDVSGIPRETVRRKLEGLRRRGWIDRHPRHGWYIAGTNLATPARQALQGLELRSFRRLARLHLRLSEVLARHGGSP
jgi:CRP-like cAMP-binding protein